MVSDIAALSKWSKLEATTKKLLLANVFCSVCHVTTITDYDIVSRKGGILLKGKCKQCGRPVARFLESEWF